MYTAHFERTPEGGFYATIQELPEVQTQGNTSNEAMGNLIDALGLVLLDKLETQLDGLPQHKADGLSVQIRQMKRTALLRHPVNCGCRCHREGSKHSIWINPAKDRKTTIPRHSEINRLLVNGVCKQLDVPPP